MSALKEFAQFLQQFGGYALASIFFGLYLFERKAHSVLRLEYVSYLKLAAGSLHDFGKIQARALEKLGRQIQRALPPKPDDEDEEVS